MMKFIVELYSEYSDYVVLERETYPGIKHLDDVRKLAGCNLPLERIDDKICGVQLRTHRIEISEDTARKSKRFEYCGMVRVRFEHLEYYLVPEYIINRDPDTGEVKGVTIKRKLDEQAIISAWEESGYELRLGRILTERR